MLTKYDPFRWQKKESYKSSLNAIVLLIEYFIRILRPGKEDKANFLNLLRVRQIAYILCSVIYALFPFLFLFYISKFQHLRMNTKPYIR